jgi:phosphopantothenoylcysteine decarboxylase/phosphopantothenate--cysteine ligase
MSAVAAAQDRRVAIHVCGSVAAYRAYDVITALRKLGCEVRVAMTRGARHFVTETTLQSLSGHAVARTAWQATVDGHGMGHIDLAAWAQVHTVVAASANFIARAALGFADDAVTTALLASRAPLLIAPAMESAMWEHPATRANVQTLRERGVTFIGPVVGRLASGAEGNGRMAAVDDVVAAIVGALGQSTAP